MYTCVRRFLGVPCPSAGRGTFPARGLRQAMCVLPIPTTGVFESFQRAGPDSSGPQPPAPHLLPAAPRTHGPLAPAASHVVLPALALQCPAAAALSSTVVSSAGTAVADALLMPSPGRLLVLRGDAVQADSLCGSSLVPLIPATSFCASVWSSAPRGACSFFGARATCFAYKRGASCT